MATTFGSKVAESFRVIVLDSSVWPCAARQKNQPKAQNTLQLIFEDTFFPGERTRLQNLVICRIVSFSSMQQRSAVPSFCGSQNEHEVGRLRSITKWKNKRRTFRFQIIFSCCERSFSIPAEDRWRRRGGRWMNVVAECCSYAILWKARGWQRDHPCEWSSEMQPSQHRTVQWDVRYWTNSFRFLLPVKRDNWVRVI